MRVTGSFEAPPPLTSVMLTDPEYQTLRDMSLAIMRRVGVETGGSNVQFAVSPYDGTVRVIEGGTLRGVGVSSFNYIQGTQRGLGDRDALLPRHLVRCGHLVDPYGLHGARGRARLELQKLLASGKQSPHLKEARSLLSCF